MATIIVVALSSTKADHLALPKKLTYPAFYTENGSSLTAAGRPCSSSPASRVAYSASRHSRNHRPGIRDEPVQQDLFGKSIARAMEREQ